MLLKRTSQTPSASSTTPYLQKGLKLRLYFPLKCLAKDPDATVAPSRQPYSPLIALSLPKAIFSK